MFRTPRMSARALRRFAVTATLTAAAGAPLAVASAADGPPRWTDTGAAESFPVAIAMAGDGTTYSVRSTGFANVSIQLVASGADGTLLWTSSYASAVGSVIANGIVVAADGTVLIGVKAEDATGPYAALLTFAPDGTLLREDRATPGAPGTPIRSVEIAASADGRRALAFSIPEGDQSAFLKVWNAADELVIDRVWTRNDSGGFGDLVFTANGDLVFTYEDFINQANTYVIRRVDATGADVVGILLPGDSSFLASRLHVAAHADSSITVAGTPTGPDGWAVRVTRITADGSIEWDDSRPVQSSVYTFATDLVAASAPGEEGAAYLSYQGEDPRIERFDPDGTIGRVTPMGVPGRNIVLTALAIDPSGRVVALMDEGTPGTQTTGTRVVRLDAAGIVDWSSTFIAPESGSARATSIAAGPEETFAIGVITFPGKGLQRRAATQRFNLAACAGDLTNDGATGFADLLGVLGAWDAMLGAAQDLDGSGQVDLADVLTVLAAWGACDG